MKGSNFYVQHKFALLVLGKREIGISKIESVERGIIVTRCHEAFEQTLMDYLTGAPSLEVRLFSTAGHYRTFSMSMAGAKLEWMPFDLDASSSNIALDRVLITGIRYGGYADILVPLKQ
jgi:hypothetical protein